MHPLYPFSDWTVIDVEQASSTNDLAAREPPWTAVRAKRQNAGRGRQGRSWSSGEGGLWLSAVLPAPAESAATTAPLVAGLAFARALRKLGVGSLRLRWPNDLMVDDRKLGGILAERPQADRITIGLGLNVLNDPERDDPSLIGQTISLCRLGVSTDLGEWTTALLESLRQAHTVWTGQGFTKFLPELDGLWGSPRPVRALVDQAEVCGRFLGVDASGNPRIETNSGEVRILYGPLVWQLFET